MNYRQALLKTHLLNTTSLHALMIFHWQIAPPRATPAEVERIGQEARSRRPPEENGNDP